MTSKDIRKCFTYTTYHRLYNLKCVLYNISKATIFFVSVWIFYLFQKFNSLKFSVRQKKNVSNFSSFEQHIQCTLSYSIHFEMALASFSMYTSWKFGIYSRTPLSFPLLPPSTDKYTEQQRQSMKCSPLFIHRKCLLVVEVMKS